MVHFNETTSDDFARVVWASHILSYLNPYTITTLNETISSDQRSINQDPNDEEDEELDGDLDIEQISVNNQLLTTGNGMIREKFLDCICDLLAHTKGPKFVIAAALREKEDSIEIDIARNNGFDPRDDEYLSSLAKFLAIENEGRIQDPSVHGGYFMRMREHSVSCVNYPVQKDIHAVTPAETRPSDKHRLGIWFPRDMKSPKLVWAPFRNYLSTRYPVCDSFLGPNHGVLFRVFIKENKRRGMELDHYLTLYYRDYDEINSKSIHRAVQACHGLTVPYQFSGDYVAMCGRHSDPVEYSGDMTLADFRHILDYFSTSFDDTIRETHSGGSVLAVQINCALEQRLYARDVFTTVAVDRDFIGTTRVISPLSEALGKSVEICKLNCDELKREGGRMDISSDDLRNPYTDILLTNMDPTSENWGKFTESPSLCGNFILLSDNGADLSLKLAQKMAGYCLEVLKPLFEKALRGEISRQDVLAEIMSENMMKWKSLEDAQDNEQFGSRRGFVARIGSPTTWNLAT